MKESPSEQRRYPLCFKCGDEVDMSFISVKVVCEECADTLGGEREGNLLIVELEAEYEMEAEDSNEWNEVPHDRSN